MNAATTPEAVAKWMMLQIEKEGDLYQDTAVADIEEHFGSSLVHENEAGNTAIARPVLEAFRKLTQDTVVWERGDRRWRKREPSDDPGRQQT